MAFFNLTKLGVQEPIESSLKHKSEEHPTTTSSSSATAAENKILSNSHQGSYVKYTERLAKHQRPEKDPNEIYRKPLISSQEYGWWKQDGALESLSWAKVRRHAIVNSEMTRFVDEMTLTNKDFTLF